MPEETSYRDHFGRKMAAQRPPPASFTTGFPRSTAAMTDVATTQREYALTGRFARPPAAVVCKHVP